MICVIGGTDDDTAMPPIDRVAGAGQQVADQHAVLVGGPAAVGLQAPVMAQRRALVDAEHRVRVARRRSREAASRSCVP